MTRSTGEGSIHRSLYRSIHPSNQPSFRSSLMHCFIPSSSFLPSAYMIAFQTLVAIRTKAKAQKAVEPTSGPTNKSKPPASKANQDQGRTKGKERNRRRESMGNEEKGMIKETIWGTTINARVLTEATCPNCFVLIPAFFLSFRPSFTDSLLKCSARSAGRKRGMVHSPCRPVASIDPHRSASAPSIHENTT